jgi:hypothetical protein
MQGKPQRRYDKILCRDGASAAQHQSSFALYGRRWAHSPCHSFIDLINTYRICINDTDVATLAPFGPLLAHRSLPATAAAGEARCARHIRACLRLADVAAGTQGRLNLVAEAARVALVPLATLCCALHLTDACLAVVACDAARTQRQLVAEAARVALVPLAPLRGALWSTDACLATARDATGTH